RNAREHVAQRAVQLCQGGLTFWHWRNAQLVLAQRAV
ncbi:hypothetical protein A2U01_0105464, partial [Trifolium medium]|nr:hypothetical protein [Trifolium medium]